jgi:16S rRNA (uracil1498-N3)-methyltransferase
LKIAARLYSALPLETGREIELPPSAAHHAARVLRLRSGDSVTLFNGEGGEFDADVLHVAREAVLVRVGSHRAVDRESPLQVTLVQGLAGADRMDWVVQKAVELGVMAIRPVTMTRSVVRLDPPRAAKREMHWRSIAISACEQCGRNRLPLLHALTRFEQWVAAPSVAKLRVFLAPDAATSLSGLARPEGSIELLVGPEGGLTREEAGAALDAGFRAVRLGPRILRTETAPLAAMSALNALWGDWA